MKWRDIFLFEKKEQTIKKEWFLYNKLVLKKLLKSTDSSIFLIFKIVDF